MSSSTDTDQGQEFMHSGEEPRKQINFYSEDTDFLPAPDQQAEIAEWVIECVEYEGFKLDEVSYIFCSDGYLLGINQEYLQHDTFTDIITFPYHEAGQLISGDIYISLDRVRENAEDFAVSFDNELHRVIIHGVLHLVGYVDGTDKDKAFMREKEDYYLARFNQR